MAGLLKDPLTIVAESIHESSKDSAIDEETKKIVIAIINDVRKDVGNKTWYIQKTNQKWEHIIELWEDTYEIQVKNSLITKLEAYREIAAEVTSLIGVKVEIFTIEHIVKKKEQHKEKILKKKGLLESGEDPDLFLFRDDEEMQEEA